MNLLLIIIAILPVETVARESCDRIEVNSFYDDQGRLVFDQLLFSDWDGERFQLRAWRMVKHQSQLPQLSNQTGRYECRWFDGELERVVSAPVVSWSRTQYDPELTEREWLAKEHRRELRKGTK